MTPRERVLAALRRERPDQVPKNLMLSPALHEEFRRRTGREDAAAYFRLEPRFADIAPTSIHRDFSGYLKGVPDIARHDEWGVGFLSADSERSQRMVHPLRSVHSPRDIAAYPWPDVLAPTRWHSFFTDVAAWHARGYPIVAGPPGSCGGSLFETCRRLRGRDQLLADFHENPDLATALLDTVNNTMIEGARRMAQAGVDILRLGDDISSRQAMLMSPDTWRRWLKPRLAALMRAPKDFKPDILILYHGGDCIEPIIPDLIEIGLDILNPVQPEGMDPGKLKREYGDRLAFWGTIGARSTMARGTPEEVRRVVRERIEAVGPEGLLLAPTDVLEPDVPWDNVVAFIEAVEEYGRL